MQKWEDLFYRREGRLKDLCCHTDLQADLTGI